jgi:hypothetical protein
MLMVVRCRYSGGTCLRAAARLVRLTTRRRQLHVHFVVVVRQRAAARRVAAAQTAVQVILHAHPDILGACIGGVSPGNH